MSMLIIGVNPPKSCYSCSWYNKVDCPVNDGRYYYRAQRHPDCPLVEVKEPHGDLVDRGWVRDSINYSCWIEHNDYLEAIGIIDDAPTIIESEEGE